MEEEVGGGGIIPCIARCTISITAAAATRCCHPLTAMATATVTATGSTAAAAVMGVQARPLLLRTLQLLSLLLVLVLLVVLLVVLVAVRGLRLLPCRQGSHSPLPQPPTPPPLPPHLPLPLPPLALALVLVQGQQRVQGQVWVWVGLMICWLGSPLCLLLLTTTTRIMLVRLVVLGLAQVLVARARGLVGGRGLPGAGWSLLQAPLHAPYKGRTREASLSKTRTRPALLPSS